MAVWSALSFAPDADVIGFALGEQYSDPWGHRGAMHSFAFAIVLGTAFGLATAKSFGRSRLRSSLLAIAVVASHPLLDTLTDGGLGRALLWPFDLTRYFAPWRPIMVAPMGSNFFSQYGLLVAMNELIPKLKAITDARGGMDERIYMRADKKADYGTVAKVMGQLSGAGFKRLALVTEVEQGS